MLGLALALGCAGGEESVRDLYGAWRLEPSPRGEHPPGTPVFVQFTPGGEALLSTDNLTLDRRRYSFRRGIPVADTAQRFMLIVEGEPDNWIVSRPNRGTLIIQPNNLEDPPRTYRRER